VSPRDSLSPEFGFDSLDFSTIPAVACRRSLALFRRISQPLRPPGGIGANPEVRSPASDWVCSRAGHRLRRTLTFDLKTTYVAGKLASLVADLQRGLGHEEHQGHEARRVNQPGLIVVQGARERTTAMIPTAELSKSRHPGALHRDPEPMKMMAQV
jgi:hypothetical protein